MQETFILLLFFFGSLKGFYLISLYVVIQKKHLSFCIFLCFFMQIGGNGNHEEPAR